MGKSIDKIDKNLQKDDMGVSDIKFYDCFSTPFKLYGFYKPYEQKKFMRIPPQFETSEAVNDGVKRLMFNTAGGRIRFRTDSQYIAIKVVLDELTKFSHMSATGVMGFDVYAKSSGSPQEPIYVKTFVPSLEDDGKSYNGFFEFSQGPYMRDITINFPLYNDISEVYIGLQENATVCEPTPYTISSPVVFYGSSVTQGCSSSRPGLCYSAILSRRLDCDIINLGFSGSARGESALAEYIAGLDMSAFVLDYDYNAQSEEQLLNTHFKFYETVRNRNPEIPIIMMSAPVPFPRKAKHIKVNRINTRIIVMESYIRGIKNGDKNLYFIDGQSLLGMDDLVDGVHPNDVGFHCMANRLYPILKQVLYQF